MSKTVTITLAPAYIDLIARTLTVRSLQLKDAARSHPCPISRPLDTACQLDALACILERAAIRARMEQAKKEA